MTQVSLGVVMDLPERYARLLPESQYELDGNQSFQLLPLLLQDSDLSHTGEEANGQAVAYPKADKYATGQS